MLLRSVLLHVAERRIIRRFMLHSRAARALALRFVAGETVADALNAVQALQDAGFSASLDHLGENVTRDGEADAARDVYLDLLDRIQERRLNGNVSVKLTQLGLELSPQRCLEHVASVVRRAAEQGNFVRIDMESAAYTDRTLEVVRCLRRRFENVGAVIQSYLRRSERDVEQLLAEGVRIRLCKGAYQEPPDIAFPRKSDVDAEYLRLMRRLLKSGIYHGIATHHEKMIRAATEFAEAEGIGRDQFEFQMLYGIRRDLQARLLRGGYRVRVYVPFGAEWFPYLTRRLAERPANLLFFLKSLFRG
jgi:proline dehydrogenase